MDKSVTLSKGISPSTTSFPAESLWTPKKNHPKNSSPDAGEPTTMGKSTELIDKHVILSNGKAQAAQVNPFDLSPLFKSPRLPFNTPNATRILFSPGYEFNLLAS